MMPFATTLKTIWHKRFNQPYNLHISLQTGLPHSAPLLLLHGLGSSGKTWRSLMRKTASGWYASAPDMLGFGDSPKPDWYQYTVDDHVRALLKMMRRTYGSKPVTIIAHSMGCIVAIRLAATYPARVKRLILYEPPLLSPEEVRSMKPKARRPSYRQLYTWIAGQPQMMFSYSRLLARLAIDATPFRVEADNWLPLERTLRNTIIQQNALNELETVTSRVDIAYGQFDFIVDSRRARRRLAHNQHIHFHKISDTHGVTRLSSAQLFKILETPARTETAAPD